MKQHFLMLLLFAPLAYAQNCTSLIYIGQPQSYDVKEEGMGIVYHPPIVGIVTLSVPLVASLSSATITPAAWDFSTEIVGLSSSSIGTSASFTFTTDSSGNITGWTFNVTYPNNGSVQSQNPGQVVTGYGGQYIDGTYYDSVGTVAPQTFDDTASTAAGAWYCLASVVDPLTAQVESLKAQVAALQSQLAAIPTATPAVAASPVVTAAVSTKGGGGVLDWTWLLGLALIVIGAGFVPAKA